PYRIEACAMEPPLAATDTGGVSACIRAAEIAEGKIAWRPGVTAEGGDAVARRKPLLTVHGLTKHFPVRQKLGGVKGTVRAVEDVSFDIYPGETVGLVGESGCGKTTVGRLILHLEAPTAGEIRFEGRDLVAARSGELQAIRRKVQVIFQDPYS